MFHSFNGIREIGMYVSQLNPGLALRGCVNIALWFQTPVQSQDDKT
jgi:hypothetical protein